MERELVVLLEPAAGVQAKNAALSAPDDSLVHGVNEVLARYSATIRPLFGSHEMRLVADVARVAEQGGPASDIPRYYRVEAADDQLDLLAEALRSQSAVKAAYIKPPAALPVLNDMVPFSDESPPVTPDYSSRQGYLAAAPGGIDARYAWTIPGGRGDGARVIDIEGAWLFSHEDLLENQGGIVGGSPSPDVAWRNHGTAVVGAIGGDANSRGITGIAPNANQRAISVFGGSGSAKAIKDAADILNPGDIILIELHRPGPRFNFQLRDDQRGYIAIEWWPDDFDAIRYAIGKGVIVVEAGGNGTASAHSWAMQAG